VRNRNPSHAITHLAQKVANEALQCSEFVEVTNIQEQTAKEQVMSKLRINNIPEDASVADLANLFGGLHEVQKVVIHWGNEPHHEPPYAFVTLDSATAANSLDTLNDYILRGKRLKVRYANKPKDYPF
jgi:RNA recognition motif-containing protein